MKKILTFFGLAIVLNMANAFAQSGTTGPLTWVLNNGTLTISGEGAMPDYESNAPWHEYRESITKVVIGDGVTSIGGRAFYECDNLALINVGMYGMTSIGQYAFYGCSVLDKVPMTWDTRSIGQYAFYGCSNLQTAALSIVTHIGQYAFYNCSSLVSLTLSGASIGQYAFYGCRGLTSITLSKMTSIEKGTFAECSKLSSIAIPESVTSIGESAFSGCSNVTSILIKGVVSFIGENAFAECTKLTSMINMNPVPIAVHPNTFQNVKQSACLLTVPNENAASAYRSAPVWEKFNIAAPFYSLNINNINAKIMPDNVQFLPSLFHPYLSFVPYDHPDYQAGYVYPADADNLTTMFSYALWIGGVTQNDELHLAAERYHQYGFDFQPGPINIINGNYGSDPETVLKWKRVWVLSASEIQQFLAQIKNGEFINGSNVPEAIRTWPAHGDVSKGQAANIAPFFDNDGDGVYDWRKGDYPLIKGDMCVFFVYNDALQHTESGGEPMNIEVHTMAYAFGDPNDAAFWNSMFFNYTIHNRSENDYVNTHIGVWADIDIGYWLDDLIGCDVERGLYFGYNGYDIDGNGEVQAYGENVPAQGVAILGGAYMDPDGYDNPSYKKLDNIFGPSFEGDCQIVTTNGMLKEMSWDTGNGDIVTETTLVKSEAINGVNFGNGIADDERLSMRNFLFYENTNDPVNGDPYKNPSDYYNYLKGLWKNGAPMRFDGNNGTGDGPITHFMFPGTSDPCNWGTNGEVPPVVDPELGWTDSIAGDLSSDARRGLGSCGPFTFPAKTTTQLDVALISAMGEKGNAHSSLETMKEYATQIKTEFMVMPEKFQNREYGYIPVGIPDSPQQKPEKLFNVYPNPVADNLHVELIGLDMANYTIYNITGQIIKKGAINKTADISVQNLSTGMYYLRIANKTVKFVKE